jgi:hypothetical protein
MPVFLQVSQPMELMQIKFVPPAPPAKPERVLTGACQSVGKRRKSAVSSAQANCRTTCVPHAAQLSWSMLFKVEESKASAHELDGKIPLPSQLQDNKHAACLHACRCSL